MNRTLNRIRAHWPGVDPAALSAALLRARGVEAVQWLPPEAPFDVAGFDPARDQLVAAAACTQRGTLKTIVRLLGDEEVAQAVRRGRLVALVHCVCRRGRAWLVTTYTLTAEDYA
jgi:hypothetical protein